MADVKGIFKYTYLFYIKYHENIKTDEDWIKLSNESKELYKQFPDQLYQDIILALIKELEVEFKWTGGIK